MRLSVGLPLNLLLLLSSCLGSIAGSIAGQVVPPNPGLNRKYPGSLGGGGGSARVQNSYGYKYFQEPGASLELGHYDARYFKTQVGYDEHTPALEHLIRSYLTTFRKLGIETWLAHGTLLGWWWNGRIMPWDYDLDVQVSHATLTYMGENHNRTMHEYQYVDPVTGKQATKTYLLDVNPHHVDRRRGDGQNVIDARWIDTSNGLFIDITALSENDPKYRPGFWSCKNNHRYNTRDLYPMRVTEFEGVEAKIPYSFDSILTDEYGMGALVRTYWQG
jgi:hypothetical protein